MLLSGGRAFHHEKVDRFTDRSAVLGFNMQLRSNWGYEINLVAGTSKDQNKEFTSYSINLSSWFSTSPTWNGNIWGGYEKVFNFARATTLPFMPGQVPRSTYGSRNNLKWELPSTPSSREMRKVMWKT